MYEKKHFSSPGEGRGGGGSNMPLPQERGWSKRGESLAPQPPIPLWLLVQGPGSKRGGDRSGSGLGAMVGNPVSWGGADWRVWTRIHGVRPVTPPPREKGSGPRGAHLPHCQSVGKRPCARRGRGPGARWGGAGRPSDMGGGGAGDAGREGPGLDAGLPVVTLHALGGEAEEVRVQPGPGH